MTITASHTKHLLHKIYKWATTNNLHKNTDKTNITLFTPDPAEYSTTLSLKSNNQTLKTTKHPKILGITLDLKLTFSQHINVAITKAKQTLHILKPLTSTIWGKQKELSVYTFKAILGPHFGICKHHMEPYHIKHQHQETANYSNTALQIATGCR